MRAHEIGGLEEAAAPPDPLAPFADDAENLLEQDLLMMTNGIRPRALQRRIQKYRRYMEDPDLRIQDVVRRYKGLVAAALASAGGLAQYVPGEDIGRTVMGGTEGGGYSENCVSSF